MKNRWGKAIAVAGAFVLLLSWFVSSPTVTRAQEETALQRIMERKTFRFCADQFNLPFSDRNTSAPGVDIELAQLIAQKWDVRATFYWTTTVHRGGMSYAYRQSILANRCDCFLGVPVGPGWEDEPARLGLALTRPHFGTGFVLAVRRDDDSTRKLEDARGSKVGVQMASPADKWLLDNGFDIVHYRRAEDALRGFNNGEVDFAFVWEPNAAWALVAGEEEYDAKMVEGFEMLPGLRLNLGMVVRAEDRDLKEKLEATIEELMHGDELVKVYARYGIAYRPPFE